MIALNLISPKQKKELKMLRFYLVIKNLTIIFLLFTIMISITLLFSKFLIQNSFNEIVESTNLTTKYGRLFNQDIEQFNKLIKQVENIQGDYINWTNFISQFIILVPQDINIHSLTFNEKEEEIIINGFAKNRADLLNFKNQLKTFELMQKIDIPLESLFDKENITFKIEGKLNLEKIKGL